MPRPWQKEAAMAGRPRSSLVLLASLVVLGGCTVATEEKIVKDFFRASRLRDNVALGTFATVRFDPSTDGQVQSFKTLEISAERSTPVSVRQHAEAVDAAKEAEQSFSKQKMAYQSANLKAIERVIKAEHQKSAVTRQDAAVQTAWTKWRADAMQHSKTVSDARQQLRAVQGPIQLSLSEPNGRLPDVSKLEGNLVEKDVTVQADVRLPDGRTESKTLVVTLARAVMREGSAEPKTGRWIVRRVRPRDAQSTS
jgi:hypothetical protein